MTDHIDHHAIALAHLKSAREVVGHDGTMEHLGFAQAHTLLAIADALTETVSVPTHTTSTGRFEDPESDNPLDEDDHRDRIDHDGDRIVRFPCGHWGLPNAAPFCCPEACLQLGLAEWDDSYGPLVFTPDTPQEATGSTESDEQPEPDQSPTPRADDAPEAILCFNCWHGIDSAW